MGHVVKIMTASEIDQLKSYYSHALVSAPPAGSVFSAKSPHYAITAYKSGKVLFQGKQAEEEASLWEGKKAPVKTKKRAFSTTTDSENRSTLALELSRQGIIGSDEVGTGDYFGPITVCSVFCESVELEKLKQLGVKDSKLLTDKKMIVMAETLKSELTYSLLILPNDKYNSLQKKGYSQGKMKAMLHNQAIKHVIRKLTESGRRYDQILIDQFAEPAIYFRYLAQTKEIVKDNVIFHTKAEGLHLSVAAASIIARAAFVKEMDRLSEQAGIALPKGAGSKVDQTAAAVIKKHGEAYLPSVAKVHFANTQKAKALI